jgi:hypothetical protein
MSGLLITCMLIAMVATAGALFLGLFSMVKGGEFNKKYSNKLMQARVMLQGAALLFLALAFFTSQSN